MKKKNFNKTQSIDSNVHKLGLRSRKCAFHGGKFCNVSRSTGNDCEFIVSVSANNSFHAEFNSSIERFNLKK